MKKKELMVVMGVTETRMIFPWALVLWEIDRGVKEPFLKRQETTVIK